MASEGSIYIYCYPRRDSNLILFNTFTRKMDVAEVNVYLDYVCEDGPKLLPDILPAEESPNCIIFRKTRALLEKIMTHMTIIGMYNEYPVLRYHGVAHEFVQMLE